MEQLSIDPLDLVVAATTDDVTMGVATTTPSSQFLVDHPACEIAAAVAVTAQAAVQADPVLVAAATILPTVVAITPAVVAIAHNQQSVETLFQEKQVRLVDTDLSSSLESLVALMRALQETPFPGLAPGFATRQLQANWQSSSELPYETIGISGVPFPSSDFVLQCCHQILNVLTHRQGYLCGALPRACHCLSKWDFFPGNVAYNLTNFALEKFMVQEASEYCAFHVDPMSWDTKCLESSSSSDDNRPCYVDQVPVRLLCSRNVYVETLAKLALQATTTIYVSSTYLHYADPAARYILLDLFPYCIRRKNLKVRLLLDLMTAEGAIVKSAFTAVKTKKPSSPSNGRSEITAESFLDWLPSDAPAFVHGADLPSSPLDFYQRLFHASNESGSDKYQIQFWCARDKQERYRIKNHSKCVVFDNQVAIFGGSNLVPTVTAAKNDLDVLVTGPIAHQVAVSFHTLWSNATHLEMDRDIVIAAPNEAFMDVIDNGEWDDFCSMAVLRSSPSSNGDDVILKTVLDNIRKASDSIVMSFGHCNIPFSVTLLLAEACKRGVKVHVIVNSIYSNDLRTDQRDLFLSVQSLLKNAPQVEVYTTSLVAGKRSPFLHGKYITIDGHWSAVGSWNMWTRSAFFEMELESFIESRAIATKLMKKFNEEKDLFCVRLFSWEDCQPFCPSGCAVCSCFGSFYVNV